MNSCQNLKLRHRLKKLEAIADAFDLAFEQRGITAHPARRSLKSWKRDGQKLNLKSK